MNPEEIDITPSKSFAANVDYLSSHPLTAAAHINALCDLVELLRERLRGESESPDSSCEEGDGCPTEMAVLKRFWRENQG